MNSLTLDYLIREPKTDVKNPPLLLLLHGYGSNEQDLFSFADELPDELLIISARAPLSLGFGSYAWYTIHFNEDSSNFSDIPEAKAALKKIAAFLEEIKELYQVNRKKVFLLGFSQGTILSIAFALNNPDQLQHVIALSGYVNQKLLEDDFEKKDHSNLDFFVSHGTADQIIPVDWARKTPGFLENLQIKHEYHEYPVGHGVAPQNFFDLKKWIEKRL
jgi:phospholipase/carboxylesterase